MSRDKKHCVVPGCPSNRSVKRFGFPKIEAIGRRWLEQIKNVDLLDLEYGAIHRSEFSVCHLHFAADDVKVTGSGKNYLKKGAHPTLLLPILIEVPADSRLDLQREGSTPASTISISLDSSVNHQLERLADSTEDANSAAILDSRLDLQREGSTPASTISSPEASNVNHQLERLADSIEDANSAAILEDSREHDDDTVKCFCGEPAKEMICHSNTTAANYGRKFYKCFKLIGEGDCRFFEWAEPQKAAPIPNPASLPSLQSGIQHDPDIRPLPPSSCGSRKRMRQDSEDVVYVIGKRPRVRDCLPRANEDQESNQESNRSDLLSESGSFISSTPVSGVPKIFRRGASVDELNDKLDVEVKKSRNLKRQLSRLQKSIESKRDQRAEQFSKCYETMTDAQRHFFDMQIDNHNKKEKGQRYSWDQKILCLAIYKRGQGAYRFLHELLRRVPSERTLKYVLSDIPLKSGINPVVVAQMTEAAVHMPLVEKYCSIGLDEFSVKPHLSVDEKQDVIKGFEEFGDFRSAKIGDKVMNVVVQGQESGWTQPFAYGIARSSTSGPQIVSIIKQSIVAVTQSTLIPLALVTDQGSTNRTAVSQLEEETKRLRELGLFNFKEKYGTLHVEGQELVHLWDIPHLGKCSRNLLSTHDLDLDYNGRNKPDEEYVTWDPVKIGFIIDEYGPFAKRIIPKWTPQHIFPEKMKKMQVKKANQVFSEEAANGIMELANIEGPVQTSFGAKVMPPNSMKTAKHLKFMDKLIDSLNGPAPNDVQKQFRVPVTEKSFHHDFWLEAKAKLHRMRYVKKANKNGVREVVREPTLRNFQKTIEGFQLLWKMHQRLGIEKLHQRNNNQDCVECINGEYRAQAGGTNNPPADQIDGIFKTLLITNITSQKSIMGGNCSRDPGKRLLTWARNIMEPVGLPRSLSFKFIRQEYGFDHSTVKYSSMAEVLSEVTSSKIFKGCDLCVIEEANGTERDSAHRQKVHLDVKDMVINGLPCVYVERDFIKKQIHRICPEVSFAEFFKCAKHREDLRELFITRAVVAYAKSVTVFINRVIDGKILLQNVDDFHEVVKDAHNIYIKSMTNAKRSTYLDIFKNKL